MNPKTNCLRALILMMLFMYSRGAPVLCSVSAQDNSPPQKPPIQTTKLLVRAQAAPVYALQYLLETPYMEQRPGNAALLYETALTLLAKTKGKYPDFDEKALSQWLNERREELPLDTVRTQLSWFDRAFHYLDLASRAEHCRWEYPIREEGLRSEMPDLASFRALTRLLIMKARLAIMDGDIEAALHSIRVGITLGRHLGSGPFVVQNFVGTSLAHHMAREIERLIQTEDAPNLYWALTALPHPLIDMRRAMQMERDALYAELPELRHLEQQALSDEKVIEIWQRILGLSKSPNKANAGPTRMDMVTSAMKTYARAQAFLREQGQTSETVTALPPLYVVLRYQHHQYRRLRDSIYKWHDVPYWQAKEGLKSADRQQLAAYDEEYTDAVIRALFRTLPSVELLYFFKTRLPRKIAMLRCVEAIRLYAAENGGRVPPSLGKITQVPVPVNPMTGRAFDYQVVDGQAVLESPASAEARISRGFRYEINIKP